VVKGVSFFRGVPDISGKNILRLEIRRPAQGASAMRYGDDLYYGGARVGLYFSPLQTGEKSIRGYELFKEIEALGGSFSSKLLDECMANPSLWPERWKVASRGDNPDIVYFFGTLYCHTETGEIYVRGGTWDDGRVSGDISPLRELWDKSNPVAMPATD